MNIIITYFRKIETIQMKANLKINKRQTKIGKQKLQIISVVFVLSNILI